MSKETNHVGRNAVPERSVDSTDRSLLGVLVEDATVSYAELGKRAALSAPAAHERVKRLRRSGVIRRTAALIDPVAVRKPLLAFVHIDTKGWKMSELQTISKYPEVEEIHTVAGDTSMLLKVRTEDTRALESLLSHLFELPGVVSTRTYVVLSTYLERPVQPEITTEWPLP